MNTSASAVERGQTQSHGLQGRWASLRLLLLAAIGIGAAGLAAPVAAGATWGERIERASAYADSRQGVVYFAVTGEGGQLHGRHRFRAAPSASVLKAMLLVAYLRRESVRHRDLMDAERALLGPMIRRSANEPATRIIGLVGTSGVNRVALVAGMRKFRLELPIWGHSEITARDQAFFLRSIDAYLPERHRRYGMRLLNRIVPSQRWGIPPVKPLGWTIYFKGGWGDGSGVVTHQVALLERGDRRISLAILTTGNPSHEYGTRTIRGIAKRLLRGLE